MEIRKKLALLIAAVLLAGTLPATLQAEEVTTVPAETAEAELTEETASVATGDEQRITAEGELPSYRKAEVKVPEAGKISEDLYEFQLELNGKAFTLLQKAGDLASLGFEPKQPLAEIRIEANEKAYVDFVAGDMGRFSATLWNPGEVAINGEEALVSEISIYAGTMKELTFQLSKGVTEKSSREEIVKLLGEPSDTETDDKGNLTLSYGYNSIDGSNIYTIRFDPDGNFSEIRIKRYGTLLRNQADISNLPEIEAKEPDNDPFALSFKLGEISVALPLSPETLLKDGWNFAMIPEKDLEPGDEADFVLYKENQFLEVRMRNKEDSPQPAEKLSIFSIGPIGVPEMTRSAHVPVELAQGIVIGTSTLDEVQALFPDQEFELRKRGGNDPIEYNYVSDESDTKAYRFYFLDGKLVGVMLMMNER